MNQLAYRSVAVGEPTAHDLAALLAQSRARNAQLGLTGLLVWDGRRFVQWLEGPQSSLDAVWASLLRDPRHTDVERLTTPFSDRRLFADWQMQLASGEPLPAVPDVWPLGAAALEYVMQQQNGTVGGFPALAALTRLPSLEDTARSLFSPGDLRMEAALEPLNGGWMPLPMLDAQLITPMCRILGRWWRDGRCTAADLVVAQGRLMALAHRMSPALGVGERNAGQVLVVASPAEEHLAGATMAALAYDRLGCPVSCEFPMTLAELEALVVQHRPDVLHLALSELVVDEQRVAAAGELVAAVRRAAGPNTVSIFIGGMALRDRPQLGRELGAERALSPSTMTVQQLDECLRWSRGVRMSVVSELARTVLQTAVVQVLPPVPPVPHSAPQSSSNSASRLPTSDEPDAPSASA